MTRQPRKTVPVWPLSVSLSCCPVAALSQIRTMLSTWRATGGDATSVRRPGQPTNGACTWGGQGKQQVESGRWHHGDGLDRDRPGRRRGLTAADVPPSFRHGGADGVEVGSEHFGHGWPLSKPAARGDRISRGLVTPACLLGKQRSGLVPIQFKLEQTAEFPGGSNGTSSDAAIP